MSNYPKVLFFSPYGQWLIHNQVDGIFAKALEIRGAEVLVTLCDGLYKNCAIARKLSPEQELAVCQACAKTGQDFFDSFSLPSVQLRNFIEPNDRDIANRWIETVPPEEYDRATYRDIPIGSWVTSSIFTYFRISKKSLSRPDVRKVHRQYLIDGLLTYKAISRLLADRKPTHLFLFNARFAPYRIAFEVARQNNIDTIVHERGLIGDSFSFRENRTCLDTEPLLDFVATWKDIPLTRSELVQVKEYFSSRERGVNTNWESFYDYNTDYVGVRHQLRIPAGAKIFSVFTSSEDELALSDRHSGITNQLAILDRLIEVFADRDEYLVIRHHPHIGGAGKNYPETDFIARAYHQARSIPSNVRIVMPSEQLTSYALLWHTDAAISFFSTMSIEAAARGIPTAVFDLSPYAQALKYTLTQSKLDTPSLAKLIEDLLSPSAQPTLDDFVKLYRFAYSYFFRFSTKFASFGVKNTHEFDIRIDRFDRLNPGCDSALDRICDRILQGSSLYPLPQEDGETRSSEDEEGFFQQEQLSLQDYRQKIDRQARELQQITANVPVGIIAIDSQSSQLLEDWKTRSRHSNLSLYHCNVPSALNFRELIKPILKIVESGVEDYILMTNDRVQYNESFISSAIDKFLSSEHLDKIGIFSGGWISETGNGIDKEIFTKRASPSTYQQAIKILPSLQNPLTLLSFVIFVRKELVRILKTIQQIETTSQAAETLFTILRGVGIYKTELPMLRVYSHHLSCSPQKLTQSQISMDLIEYYKAIKETPNSAEAYKNLGNALQANSKLEAARRAYSKAIQLKPHFAEAHANLGSMAYLQGKLSEAISHYQNAMHLQPGLVGVYWNLSKVLHQQGRVHEANFYQQRAIKLQPSLGKN